MLHPDDGQDGAFCEVVEDKNLGHGVRGHAEIA
jgi:hypothetical protein